MIRLLHYLALPVCDRTDTLKEHLLRFCLSQRTLLLKTTTICEKASYSTQLVLNIM